jgi:hypothetical protein
MINDIPKLEDIDRDLYEIKGKPEIIKVIDNTYSSGAWWQNHIGEYFLVDWDSYHNSWQAIACLTKFVKPVSYKSRLNGWFKSEDIIIVDKKYFYRERKLKRILNC